MKKRYVLNLDDRQHGALVARDGAETSVQIDDGAPRFINAHAVLGGKAFSLRFGTRMHLVHLTAVGSQGALQATVDGRPVDLTAMDELRAQALESLGSAAGSGTITADIPGLVVDIRVEPGRIVRQGEPVIVVEAMKMQNELTAAVAGTVTEIPVEVGQSVNPGDPLVVIEPEPGG